MEKEEIEILKKIRNLVETKEDKNIQHCGQALEKATQKVKQPGIKILKEWKKTGFFPLTIMTQSGTLTELPRKFQEVGCFLLEDFRGVNSLQYAARAGTLYQVP